jgi:hypothetical protein
MTTKSNVAAASVAVLCLVALAPQPASAYGGGVPRTTVLRNVNLQPHRAAVFTSPGVQHALNTPHSNRVGVLTNTHVSHVLNPGYVLGPPHHAGNGALLPPGHGTGGVLPGGGSGPAPVAAPGGDGSGPGPSVAPQGGPGFGGGDLSNVIPSVGSDQPAVPASGPALQPVVAGPSAAVTPVVPPNPCSCLTKATLADGTVFFRDLCTNQVAVAPAAQAAAVPVR